MSLLVNIWINNIKSELEFNEYIKIKYTEDGVMLPSKFMYDANIKYYPEDGQEFIYHKKPLDINEAFIGHSYVNTFQDILFKELKYKGISEIRSQYLIYENEDKIIFNETRNENNKLIYIGKFNYEK